MPPSIINWGLRVGRISGIVVRIHWVLLGYWLFQLDDYLKFEKDGHLRSLLLGYWAVSIAASFAIILLHEFGHCYAARRVGGDADEVLLWPLGGLAFVHYPRNWRAQFIVAAGGPAVNVAIALVIYPTAWLIEWQWPSATLSFHYLIAKHILTSWNLFILVFNLIPLYPLDGGKMFHALAWRHQERKGGYGGGPHYRATIATVWATRITAGAVIVAFLFQYVSMFGALIAVLGILEVERLRREAQHFEPDSAFGYDFSQGYTSLERSAPKAEPKRDGWLGRWKKRRAAAAREASADDERRLDALLEKIGAQGMGSLSAAERRFLEKMSKRRLHGG